MTVSAIADHLRHLVTGDPKEWRYLPYLLSMKLRRVDFSWVSAEESGLTDRERWHSNSGGPDLEKVLEDFSISPSDAAIDFGCGKGGALLTMARYPFGRVDGVEIASNLVEIARANLRKLRVQNSEIYCCDAASFTQVDIYNYIYMYNPFAEAVVRQVLDNVTTSLWRRPRTVTLIYKNPTCGHSVLDAGFRKVRDYVHSDPHFSIYTI
jgi:hypothetical protein